VSYVFRKECRTIQRNSVVYSVALNQIRHPKILIKIKFAHYIFILHFYSNLTTQNGSKFSEKRKSDGKLYNDYDITHYAGIYWLNKGGKNNAEISRIMNIPRQTVSGIVIAQNESNTIDVRKERERPVRDDERLGRHVEHLAEEDPFNTFDQLVKILNDGGVAIFSTTLISILNDRGFASYIAAHTPKISDQNKEKRVEWCHEHVQWPLQRWDDLIWSDESQFTIERSTSSTRVIRKKGERYDSQNTITKPKYSKGNVWVWVCF
jgi:hypothetical protein